jgi:predicted enzyme involved in methoxymalonyl-ACP biosynthesis
MPRIVNTKEGSYGMTLWEINLFVISCRVMNRSGEIIIILEYIWIKSVFLRVKL